MHVLEISTDYKLNAFSIIMEKHAMIDPPQSRHKQAAMITTAGPMELATQINTCTIKHDAQY